ncbi:MAG: endo-1,4-beta-xylanase [Ignavibacteriaceae bacterium]
MQYRIKVVKFFLLAFIIQITCSKLPGQTSLKTAFKNYFLIGTALNNQHVFGKDIKAMKLLEEQFNSITPENLLKWESIHMQPGKYNFTPADSFVALGERYKMFIVGHCLIWHSQVSKWVFEDSLGKPVTREVLLQRMKDHIYTVVGRYKGRINGWDVVNEAVEDDGSLRKTKWLQIIGEDYIEKAFQFAHEADPDAELYYNDFDQWKQGKRETVVKIIKNLKSKSIKITGIGIQGHWGLDYPPMDEMDSSMKAYSEAGCKLMITELDMDILPNPYNYTGADVSKKFALTKESNPYAEGLPDFVAALQAKRYAEYFKLFLKYKGSLSRVTFWGMTDVQSWRNNWPIRGRAAYPLLFDKNYQPKPAFDAVIKSIPEMR